MKCDLSEAKLWSWIDREAPELEAHLAGCESCRRRAARIREDIRLICADFNEAVPIPERIGSYTIQRLIGEGGQALVYEARQDSPPRTVALKVLRGGRFAGENHIRHFLRETRTMARLHHPAIATIHEAGRTDEGLHYFAMELLEGRPLNTWLEEDGPDRAVRLGVFVRICEAIQYAHDNGVVHRDLKPSNILVTAEGVPKVLDFGLARLTRADTTIAVSLTRTGLMAGTPRYMSPEQIKGSPRDVGPHSDVYALGVILYEMLTGQPAFDAASFTAEAVMAICEEEPVRPSRLDPSLRGDLETIILKAMAKQPSHRFASAGDLAEDLRRYLAHAPIKARPPSLVRLLLRSAARHPLAAAALVVLIAAAGYLAWDRLRPPFDREVARREILNLRYEYFLENPASRVNRHAAVTVPDRYPGLPEGELLKALAIADEGEPELAMRHLDGVLAAEPDQWLYRALRSDIGVVKDTTLESSFARWCAEQPGTSPADCWYLRTFTTQDPVRAMEYCRRALERDPDHRLALEMTTHLGSMAGDVQAGIDSATRLLALGDPRRMEWLDLRSRLYCQQGRFDAALRDVDLMVRNDPDAPRRYMARAQIHRWQGDYAAALADCDTAIALEESDSMPVGWYYYHRGTPQTITGGYEAAIADYRAAFRSLARTTYGNARLVLLLRELGRPEEARRELDIARERVENDPWIDAILACLAGEKSPGDLVAVADPRLPQQRCEAYYYAGEVLRLAGRTDEAAAMFRACLETGHEVDQGNYRDRLSEVDLAGWRLASLTDGP